jgi:hypothetical protein
MGCARRCFLLVDIGVRAEFAEDVEANSSLMVFGECTENVVWAKKCGFDTS